MLFSVEGNIGAGKSTLLKQLESFKLDKKHVVVYEPVDEWLAVKPEGPDTLSLFEKYYQNKKRYGFLFQMYALQSRIKHITEMLKAHPNTIIICERTHLTDSEIFAKMLSEDGLMDKSEYFVYRSWYDHACTQLQELIRGVIYLRATPPTCMKRIAKRNRDGEGSINVDYIKRLFNLHEDWLLASREYPVLVVDGDKDVGELDYTSIKRFINSASIDPSL